MESKSLALTPQEEHLLLGAVAGEPVVTISAKCDLEMKPGSGDHGNHAGKDSPQRLSLLVKGADGSGHVLNDLCASLWFSYLLLYLQNVVQMSNEAAAGLLLLGQVVDAAATPLIGYVADRSINCFLCNHNYGQCKSWHLMGTLFVLISFPFVFSPCIGCNGWGELDKFLYYAFFIAIFQIGWASTQVSHLALLPKMTSHQLKRTELLAIRYGFTVGSNVTVFVIAWLTFGWSENCIIDASDDSKFRNLALMAVAIGSVFVLFFHLVIRERSNLERPAVVVTESNKQINDNGEKLEENTDVWPANILSTRCLGVRNKRMTVKDWLRLPQLYIVAGIYMATRLSVNVTQVYVPIYLQDSLKLPCGTVATIPLTMYLSGFVVAVVIKSINKFLGRQLSYTLGASLSVLGSFLIITLDWQGNEFLRDYGIYGVAALLGGGASAILVTSLSITADLIGNNIETGAFIYGAMSFTDKLSCGLAVMLINSLLPKPNQELPIPNDSLTVNFYRNVVGYTCGGCAIVGVLSVVAMSYIIFREESQGKKKSIKTADP